MKQKLLIIVGPTSSGKSALGVELAKIFNGEVISADSRQVYTGLNIGTGKVTKREMKGVPHHLLDVANPKKVFSAEDFAKLARAAVEDITGRGKLPILVGGTGFYIDSLVGRISLPDVPPNKKLRSALEKKSVEQLFALLTKKDSRRAKALSTPSERNNKIRLIRALEIVSSVGKVPSKKDRPLYDALWIGIAPQDKVLRKKITIRLFARIRLGMISEAKKLHARGLTFKRMGELGLEYRSLARLLQKKITKADFEKELDSDIWHYARKQIGYWNRNTDILWFGPKQISTMGSKISAWLKK